MSLQVIGKATIDMDKFRAFPKRRKEKGRRTKVLAGGIMERLFL